MIYRPKQLYLLYNSIIFKISYMFRHKRTIIWLYMEIHMEIDLFTSL